MFDISKLKNNIVEYLNINESIDFKNEDLKNTEIKRLKDIKAIGRITRLSNDLYNIELNIKGTMVLECARSLEEIDYPIDIMINKNIEENVLEDEKQVIFNNSLDIFSIVWENIVLEVPLRVVKEDASYIKEGDGWNLVGDDEIKNDSPFNELKSMLDMEGKE